MKQLTFTILLTLISISSFGQKTICGPDTIRLELNGYEYGAIQWEESYDSTNWAIIPGAIDTVYEAYVDENKYFRAQLVTSVCPPEYSEVFTVNMPVKANAGIDRPTPNSEVRLHPNEPAGSNCTWRILSGSNGTLGNPDTASSYLYGTLGNTYQLEWKLANTCGISRDTVEIKFVENDYINNIIYIDSTDHVLSDSAEIADSTLRVIFSDSTVTPNDSSSILFLTESGYNLKSVGVDVHRDTFEIQVIQGTIADILENGAIDFSPNEYQDASVQRRIKELPTRKKLLNGEYHNGEILYRDIKTPGIFDFEGFRKQSSGAFAMSLSVNKTIYSDNNMDLDLFGEVEFVPNIVAYYERSGFSLDTLVFGLENASLTTNLGTQASLYSNLNLIDVGKNFLLYSQEILFMAGPVPVWVTTDVYLKTSFTVNASGEIIATFDITTGRSFDAIFSYDKIAEEFKTYKNSGPSQRTVTTDISGKASLSQEFKAGPGFSLSLYKVLTGYVNLYAIKENFDACFNIQTDWEADFNLTSEVELGGHGEVLGWEFFDENTAFDFGWYSEQFPENLTVYQGDEQNGQAGTPLAGPIGVQVRSKGGVALPHVNVYFEPIHGSVDDNLVKTNSNGVAKTDWTPESGPIVQKLEVFVKDCDDNTLAGPDTFTAYISCNGTPPTAVVDVTNPSTGKTWMDRNLGASRVATSNTDSFGYGDLYQWGRGPDGHQCRNSSITSTLSSSNTPGHESFIAGSGDWRSPQNTNLWQGVNGVNNPCPGGYRLPTEAEWEAERESWSSDDANGAYDSPLKLPQAGYRIYSNGSLIQVSAGGWCWSSTVDGIRSRYLYFHDRKNNPTGIGTGGRANGLPVRCIKN